VGEFEVGFTVRAARPALYAVWDAEAAGHFSANGLVLHPCWPRNVSFHGAGTTTLAELQKRLELASLWQHQWP
jgi:hypothetical protein